MRASTPMKPNCRSPFRSGLLSAVTAVPPKRKGRSSKRKGNHGCPFLFAPAASAAIPAVICGKTFRPGRANRFRGSGTPESRYCEKATLCLRGYWEMKYSVPSPQQGGLLGRSGACRHKGALPHACRPVRWWIRFAAAKPRRLKRATGTFLRAGFRIHST